MRAHRLASTHPCLSHETPSAHAERTAPERATRSRHSERTRGICFELRVGCVRGLLPKCTLGGVDVRLPGLQLCRRFGVLSRDKGWVVRPEVCAHGREYSRCGRGGNGGGEGSHALSARGSALGPAAPGALPVFATSIQQKFVRGSPVYLTLGREQRSVLKILCQVIVASA